jgi:hypothetical protein
MYNLNGESFIILLTKERILIGRDMDYPPGSSHHCWYLFSTRWNRIIHLRIRSLAPSHLCSIGQCYFPSCLRLR